MSKVDKFITTFPKLLNFFNNHKQEIEEILGKDTSEERKFTDIYKLMVLSIPEDLGFNDDQLNWIEYCNVMRDLIQFLVSNEDSIEFVVPG